MFFIDSESKVCFGVSVELLMLLGGCFGVSVELLMLLGGFSGRNRRL